MSPALLNAHPPPLTFTSTIQKVKQQNLFFSTQNKSRKANPLKQSKPKPRFLSSELHYLNFLNLAVEKYRSMSYRDGDHGVKAAAPTSMQELRSYSVNYAPPNQVVGKEVKMKKSNNNVRSFSKSWSLNDNAELQRKRRITGYKAYAMKGKMKGSLRKSVRWIKDTCTQAVYGWR